MKGNWPVPKTHPTPKNPYSLRMPPRKIIANICGNSEKFAKLYAAVSVPYMSFKSATRLAFASLNLLWYKNCMTKNMNKQFKILIVEDDKLALKTTAMALKKKGYNVYCFENAEEAFLFFQENTVDLALLDYELPGMSGRDFFEKIKALNPLIPVIFVTGHPSHKSIDKAVELIKMGAYTYLTKPFNMETLFHNIDNALEKLTLLEENKRLQERLQKTSSYENFVFKSDKMQRILQMAMKVAESSSTVLITGESGTGKEVIANILHDCSPRKNKNFVTVNLSALPEPLIECELFGHKKGAFTDAREKRDGKFIYADEGTLFLDEIGELPVYIQVKLLHVLQERKITPIGDNKSIDVDFRLITATNKDLQGLIKEKKFREDLYYRLDVIGINIPPLRERKEEIPYLIDYFIKIYNKKEGKQIQGISREALNALMKYHFPGNIRELENIIERALVLARDDILTENDLPPDLPIRTGCQENHLDSSLSLPERLNAIEKNILINCLKKHNNRQQKTADELKISESRLRYRMKILGIGKREVYDTGGKK